MIGERDSNGHGTPVAAIAASGGLATGHGLPAGRYVGIAPGAELIVAQTTHGGSVFSDTDVLTACPFVLDPAAAPGRPIVGNLSLGRARATHPGPTHPEPPPPPPVPLAPP